jgi:galactokinase
MIDVEALKTEFQHTYGRNPHIFRAPGRVNLIGEHTDYNEGFVMPAALEFATWVAIAPRDDHALHLRSRNMGEPVDVVLGDSLCPRHDWSDYVVGVANEIEQSGAKLHGADLLIDGRVPVGSGLSSSAALEVASGLALLESNGNAVDRTQLALLCQRAENQFVGTRCGIMDQFISCHGKQGHALMLDCRDLSFRLLPVPTAARMVVCNTMVKHELATGEYNLRRSECEQGVRLLSEHLPGIHSLRDVSYEDFERHADDLPETVRKRCRHVITENARVQLAADALESGNLPRFGELMYQSHESLRDDYEVSCTELDVMVEQARGLRGVFGARMTGGGFGGCAVALVEEQAADAFARDIATGYERETGIRPEIYVTQAAEGAGRIA